MTAVPIIEVVYHVSEAEFDRAEFSDKAIVSSTSFYSIFSRTSTTRWEVKEYYSHDTGAVWVDDDGAPIELEQIVFNPHFRTMKVVL